MDKTTAHISIEQDLWKKLKNEEESASRKINQLVRQHLDASTVGTQGIKDRIEELEKEKQELESKVEDIKKQVRQIDEEKQVLRQKLEDKEEKQQRLESAVEKLAEKVPRKVPATGSRDIEDRIKNVSSTKVFDDTVKDLDVGREKLKEKLKDEVQN